MGTVLAEGVGRARAQREAERRVLPRVLEAHEVELFQPPWEREALGPAEHALEERGARAATCWADAKPLPPS